MARITIRSECPDCGKKIKFVAEARSEVRGQCPRCGCWMKIPVGSVGVSESKSSGPDSALPLITEESSRPKPPAVPAASAPAASRPPLPNVRPAAPKAGSAPVLKAVSVPPTIAAPRESLWSRWGLSMGVISASVVAVAASVWLLRSGKTDSPADPTKTETTLVAPDPDQTPGTQTPNTPVEKSSSSTTDPGVTAPDPLLVAQTPPVRQKPDPVDQGGARGRETKIEKPLPIGLGERYALLVSVRDYDEETTGLTSLQYTENDVNELAKVLVKSGYGEHNVTVMSQSKAITKFHLAPERNRILDQLDRLLADRTPEDTVLIAFAGHGVKFQGSDDSYFCPLGTDLDDRNSLIAYKEVYDRLAKCPASFKLLLSDACRNEPLAKGSGSRRATVDLDSVTRPPEPPRTGGVAAFFACSPEQVAFEHKEFGHGVFFHYVIEALKGEADVLPKDGVVTLGELNPYVTTKVQNFVRSTFSKKQSPNFFGDLKGEFALVRLPKEAQVTLPPVPPPGTTPGQVVAGTTPGNPGTGSPSVGKPPVPPIEEPPPIQPDEDLAAKNKIPEGVYPPSTAVPTVRGETVARAREMLHAVGLGLDFPTNLVRDSDIVGSQGTVAGKVVPTRSIVRLGNLKAKVPNVVGMTYRDAFKLLQEREGFKVLSALTVESELKITDQVPSAGAFETRGSRITINHMVPVPNVTTLDIDTALRRLEEAGLKGTVETAYQKGDPVFFQTPKGAKIAVGLEVRLTPGVVAPNITNMPISQANAVLVRSGINGRVAAIRTIKTSDSSLAGEPIVTNQAVAAGQVMSRKLDLSVHCIQYQYAQ